MHTATYSPEDNKLRLYPAHRLDKETYERVKAAGFKWAPRQELFVAPMWTPEREDLLLELCDEIGDEDTSLVERAEERAERFEEYSDNRAEDAERARKAVDNICEFIPLGQPILVGHHSEKRARKDAEKIQNGMRRAVKMWETSKYWTARAAGALRHAKYKELPAVRHRRIKGLEADLRKQERYKAEAEGALHLWTECQKEQDKELQLQVAIRIAGTVGRLTMPRKEGDRPDFDQRPDAYTALTNSYPSLYAPRTLEEVFEVALSPNTYPRRIAHQQRWIDHYTNRIAYERAMLDEQGGLAADAFDFQPGGRILRRGEWLPIVKVNRRNGVVNSVSVMGHFASTVTVDEIRDYRPPSEEDATKVKAATDPGPMCNYPGEGFKHMTTAEWKAKKMSDVPQREFHKATETHGKHRTRATWGGNWSTVAVYLTDAKRVDPPAPAAAPPVKLERQFAPPPPRVEPKPAAEPNAFDAMKDTLRAGVQVVTAPQLFPTPPELAARMVEEADIQPGQQVLEPSAGTGNIIEACRRASLSAAVVAVELNTRLAQSLRGRHDIPVVCGDFLEQNGNLGKFDRVLMNPPFANGADIQHIKHAIGFLKPGGRLVAICANGPRQNEALRPIADTWEPLPAGTFAEAGTNVNAVLLTVSA